MPAAFVDARLDETIRDTVRGPGGGREIVHDADASRRSGVPGPVDGGKSTPPRRRCARSLHALSLRSASARRQASSTSSVGATARSRSTPNERQQGLGDRPPPRVTFGHAGSEQRIEPDGQTRRQCGRVVRRPAGRRTNASRENVSWRIVSSWPSPPNRTPGGDQTRQAHGESSGRPPRISAVAFASRRKRPSSPRCALDISRARQCTAASREAHHQHCAERKFGA